MSIHDKGRRNSRNRESRKSFLAERAEETVQLGRLLIILGPPILGYFTLQDNIVIGLPGLLPYRLVPLVALFFYGIFIFTPWAKSPRLMLWVHCVLLSSISFMALGLGYLVFSRDFLNQWQKSVSASGILASLVTIHLFSGIARPYFLFIAGIPLLLLVTLLGIQGYLDLESFSMLSNALYVGIAVSVVSILQEKMRFRDFKRKSQTVRKNIELEMLAGTDELTGLQNRRAGMAVLNRLLEQASREKSPFTVCFLDADGLKRVNDEFGHREGDYYLQTIARTVEKMSIPAEHSARMGGDEFILLFPGRRESEAEKTVQAIQKELHRISQSHPFSLEVSHGLAEYDPVIGQEAKDLLKLADSRMYQYKQSKKRTGE